MLKYSENIIDNNIRYHDCSWHYDSDTKSNNPVYLNSVIDENGSFNFNKSVETSNINIDPVPPKFISDSNTDYIALSPSFDNSTGDKLNTVLRHFEFIISDSVGIDTKQFGIYLDKTDTQNELTLYEFFRFHLDEDPSYNGYTYADEDGDTTKYIRNIKLFSIDNNQYKLSFDLTDLIQSIPNKHSDDNTIFINDITNYQEKIDQFIPLEGRLSLHIYDIANNYSLFKINKEFITIDIDDLNNLVPVEINFNKINPENYFLNKNIQGEAFCEAYNSNTSLWKFPIVCELSDTSIGKIDLNTYFDSYDYKTGTRVFKINELNEHGFITVNGWIETGNKNIDSFIKERTFNSNTCGPWIYEDDGRKYNIVNYVPKCLRNTDFYDFIEFFQLYLNTMYISYENKNISTLEKIARINNFNDIDLIENNMLLHYEKQFGNEIIFNKETIKKVDSIISNNNLDSVDENNIYNIIKYVLGQLPNYNQYKGTNKGMTAAIKMFGFVCKIINLWCKIEDDNDILVEEDRLDSFADYFMTSRFNIEFNSSTNSIDGFKDNLDFFISLIKNIKPITKILDLIKYTVVVNKNIHAVHKTTSVVYDTDIKYIDYNFSWRLFETASFHEHKFSINDNKITGFYLNYTPIKNSILYNNVEQDINFNNYYNPIAHFFYNLKNTLIFELNYKTIEGSITKESFKLDNTQYKIDILNGSVYVNIIDDTGRIQTSLYNAFNKHQDCDIFFNILMRRVNNTDFVKCLQIEV